MRPKTINVDINITINGECWYHSDQMLIVFIHNVDTIDPNVHYV